MIFNIDSKSNTTEFPHYWEKCVGSCHAYTALRADYREQLKKVHDELGFEYVRFHGLFNDDMCILKKNGIPTLPSLIWYTILSTPIISLSICSQSA